MRNPEITANLEGDPRQPAARVRGRLGGTWRALALLPVLVLAAALIWREAATPAVEVVAAPSVDDPAPQVLGLPTLTEAPPEPSAAPVEAAPIPEPSAVSNPEVAAAPSAGGRPVAPPTAPQVVRLRIPSLAVDAAVQQMGLDAAGAMEVPYNPATVAWYGFTAAPGSPGNAVMSGHVDWLGARAVFYGIRTLQAGDIIEVTTSEGSVRYSVERTYLVRPEEADVAEIVGQRRGPETLTLITCGGTFDRSKRDYDQRVIVRATRL